MTTAQSSGAQVNRLKTLWPDGRTAIGAIATIPSVQTVQIMARSGLDWILIDMEHGAIDHGAAHAMIAATSAACPGCCSHGLAGETASRPWRIWHLFPHDDKALHRRWMALCHGEDQFSLGCFRLTRFLTGCRDLGKYPVSHAGLTLRSRQC